MIEIQNNSAEEITQANERARQFLRSWYLKGWYSLCCVAGDHEINLADYNTRVIEIDRR